MNKITFTHLKKLLSCQPFFVWYDLNQNNKMEDDALNFEKQDIEFNLPSFPDEYSHSLSEIQNKSFDIINKSFLNKMCQKLTNLKIVPSGSAENRAQMTKNWLLEKNSAPIFNPIFIYEYFDQKQKYQVISNPILYNPQTKTVHFLKMSTNTKRGDIIKFYFDVEVMRKLKIPVQKVELHIIATKMYKKGEVDFFATQFLNLQKSGPTFKNKNSYNYYQEAQLLKAGLANENAIHILKTIENKKIGHHFNFQDLDNYLLQIIHAKKYQKLDTLNNNDNQYLIDCHVNWKTIMQINGEKKLQNFNGKLVKKEDIINATPLEELMEKRPLLKKILKNQQKVLVNVPKVEKIIQKLDQEFTVWFDFEAFTLPISPIDNFLPFSHVVSQVSVIKTQKMQEVDVKNIVLDPQIIKYSDFEKIVDAIYDKRAHYYVVYNASYEKSRLNDIIFKMQEVKYPKVKTVSKKVQSIIKKIVDLADLFIVNSIQKTPPILITELKGMYSIKKLEKYIHQNYPNFEYQIKKYQDLAISNGLYALEITNNRALDIIGDNEWKIKVKQLGEYCENDVRAMIMVFHFVQKILKTNIS